MSLSDILDICAVVPNHGTPTLYQHILAAIYVGNPELYLDTLDTDELSSLSASQLADIFNQAGRNGVIGKHTEDVYKKRGIRLDWNMFVFDAVLNKNIPMIRHYASKVEVKNPDIVLCAYKLAFEKIGELPIIRALEECGYVPDSYEWYYVTKEDGKLSYEK